MEEPIVYNFINDDELLRISNKIMEMEKITAGEICVSIKQQLKFSERKKSVKELSENEFFKNGLDKTRDKTGILIFILLTGRKFFILADEGINKKVPENTWESIKDEMQQMFVKGDFCNGILLGVEKVGRILSEHFPIKPDDTNEIPNKVIID